MEKHGFKSKRAHVTRLICESHAKIMRIPCEYHAHTLEAGNDAPLQSGRFPFPIVASREKEKRREQNEEGSENGLLMKI